MIYNLGNMGLRKKIGKNISKVNKIIDCGFYFIPLLGIRYDEQKTIMIIQKEHIDDLDYIHVFEFANRNDSRDLDKIYCLCSFMIDKKSNGVFISYEDTDIEIISPVTGIEYRVSRGTLLDFFMKTFQNH